jgi:Zn finger protein HypA/HybF involved in hydrogenase expression
MSNESNLGWLSDKGYELSTHEKQQEFAKKRCWCHTCRPITMEDMRMVLCPSCGNKRCPRATNHNNACTNSNEPNQEGNIY